MIDRLRRGLHKGLLMGVVVAMAACSSAPEATRPERSDLDEPVSAAQWRTAAAEEAALFDLPPGATLRTELLDPVDGTRGTLMGALAFRVACQWHRHWLDLVATDGPGADEARRVLLEMPSWPEFDEGMPWDQFHDGLEDGAIDGPQWFVGVNCSQVRDELPPPATPPFRDRSRAVIDAEKNESAVALADRAEVIAGVVPPAGGVPWLDELAGTDLEQTRIELEAVTALAGWCDVLGEFIDAADALDATRSAELIPELEPYVGHSALAAVDAFTLEGQIREEVVADAKRSIPRWPVAEYRGNCFGFDPDRDARLSR